MKSIYLSISILKVILPNISNKTQNNKHNKNNNIHNIKVTKGNVYNVPVNIAWFNHYNLNKKQLEWMKGFYKKCYTKHGKHMNHLRK